MGQGDGTCVLLQLKGEFHQIHHSLGADADTDGCFQDVDVHGRIYTDSEFGSLQLSEDNTSLYYIAEKKKEKNVPFLSQAPLNTEAQIGGEYK